MIKVENVSFTYPSGVNALKNVSIEISNGEFVAIMGENGAGKTTLVKQFNGLLKPGEGDVYVDGRNTRDLSVAELSKDVGLVFQNADHQLFCETVEDEIAFGLRNFGFSNRVNKKRVKWALTLLNLQEYRKTSPFMLSGGERKRVALASVLAWKPRVTILDEPTVGQDQSQKERLLQFVRQLNTQGNTVILVTHDLEFVAECDPRVVLMSHGRIVADGPAKKILTNPKLIKKTSLILPQITQLFFRLADLGFPKDVISIYEAKELINDFVARRS